MLDKDQTVSYIIKDEYSNIKKSCELNQNMDKIYDYTPHPIRYTCLQYLKLVSLPISIAFYVAKLCLTANPVWTWIGVNNFVSEDGSSNNQKNIAWLT